LYNLHFCAGWPVLKQSAAVDPLASGGREGLRMSDGLWSAELA
jgi:hypothetical protein